MTEVDTVVSGARNLLRDFPIFFEVDAGPLSTSTLRLPHPLVPMGSLQVVSGSGTDSTVTPTPVPKTDIELDERNGLLKFLDPLYFGKRILVAGYHFTWFLDTDLAFHANRILVDVGYGRDVQAMADFTPIETDTIYIGTVVSSLWALTTELSLDIDVSTPEGMYIPARQRYQQVMQLWQSWSGQYIERMGNLNLGSGRVEQFDLRRVARLTNRLVPLYREREIDDHRPPHRLHPVVPTGESVIDASPDRRPTQEEIWRNGQETTWIGW